MARNMRFQDVLMTPHRFLLCLVAILLLSCPPLVGAAHNVTVDDSDTTQIIYSPPGSWKQTPLDPLNFGGRHRVTLNPDATATFTFTGTAIYFYSPGWPFDVSTAISLDGAGPVTLSLIDPDTVVPVPDGAETVASSVAWFADGLDNVQHTFVVSVAAGTELAIVDGFMYTVPDAGDPTTTTGNDGTPPSTMASSTLVSSSSSFLPLSSTPASSASSSSSHTAKKGLSIALGIVLTVFALLVLYGVYWYWRRRQRLLLEQQEEEEFRRNNPSSVDTETPPMGYVYKRQPSTWQRNARGRLVAAPTGITTMIPTVEPDGSLSGPITGVSAGSGRGRRKPPRPHGPSPLSMSTSSTSSIAPASPGSRGKKPLTTIPEMRMREDLDYDGLSSASSNTAVGSVSPFADRPMGAGTKNWTTFDQTGS